MKEIAQHLRKTVEGVLPSLRVISDEKAVFKPNPSKWSKKEILGHLIDSACNNQQKFVRALRRRRQQCGRSLGPRAIGRGAAARLRVLGHGTAVVGHGPATPAVRAGVQAHARTL